MEEEKDPTISVDILSSLLESQADSVIDKPYIMEVELDDTSMIPKKYKEPIDKIIIKPLKVYALAQMIPLLVKLKEDEINAITVNQEVGFNPESINVFEKYQNIILEIIFIGIHNKPSNSPKWFKEMLIKNFTWKELHSFLNAILFRMDSQSFLNSIILSKRMSPMDDKGIIAMSKNLQDHLISTQS